MTETNPTVDDYKLAVAGEIRAEIARSGTALKAIQEELDVSEATLRRILKGENDISAPKLFVLCHLFGVPMDELLGRAEAAAFKSANAQ